MQAATRRKDRRVPAKPRAANRMVDGHADCSVVLPTEAGLVGGSSVGACRAWGAERKFQDDFQAAAWPVDRMDAAAVGRHGP